MKKLLYSLLAVFALYLWACTGNSPANEVVQYINDAVQREEAFKTAMDNGEKTISDITNDDFFLRPLGFVFANPSLIDIIKKNADYKLTPKDKKLLTEAVVDLDPPVPASEMSKLDSITNEGRNHTLSQIENAETLGDLLDEDYPTQLVFPL